LSQLKNGFQDLDNILLFVVRRYDDDLFQMAYNYRFIMCRR
jgi:hypothetical protein